MPEQWFALWRRLDGPGHDACRLRRDDRGWRIDGTAVFREGGETARLEYRLEGDPGWNTRRGEVHGWIGERCVQADAQRGPDGIWTLNGREVPGLGGCADLDLGFTPATNALQIRRLALAEGQEGEAPAAWLDIAGPALELLEQRYERRARRSYWYVAPRFGYAALLEVDESSGFVLHYPGLWRAEA